MGKLFLSEKRKMMNAIDRILAGEADEINPNDFHNKKYANKINRLIEYTRNETLVNTTVMRLNSAMEALGDNTLIKQTFERIGSQKELLSGMQQNHQSIESSIGDISANIGDIRDNTKNLLNYSEHIVGVMSDNIKEVQSSTAKLNEIDKALQEFKENIATIHKIVDTVQHIARESNILALNASVEAGRAGISGKGFNVIAENMRRMTLETQTSSDEIAEYVSIIENTVESIANSMKETTSRLTKENQSTEVSLSEVAQMNSQLTDIQAHLDSIFSAIDMQTNATHSFARQMDDLKSSNDLLANDCLSQGTKMFKIGRYNDKTRSDILKKNSHITKRDWLSIFEVDHFVLTWRVYNNIVGFEQLKSSQVDDPSNCKLGKWLTANANTALSSTPEFIAVKHNHDLLHTFATNSFNAKNINDTDLALDAFNQTLNQFYELRNSIRALDSVVDKMGNTAVTEYVPFGK